jgi:catechol 2,3-dioxygenase-like lactoylglutathione lyase family enzyme
MNLNQITLPALDIRESIDFYRNMGFLQIVDAPRYARFECTEGDSTFSLHAVEKRPDFTGVVVYFECRSVDEAVKRLEAKGFPFSSQPTDERWLWREARLVDPSGNVLCLFNPGQNRKTPPWRLKSAASASGIGI